MGFIDALIAMWYRQIKRFIRAKPRVIGTILHPIFWLILFGVGFSASMRGALIARGNYLDFLFPGIVMMTVFTSSFMSGVSVIWDKEFGYLKVVLVSPAPRKASFLGRSLGDSTISVFQGIIILIFGSFLVGIPSITDMIINTVAVIGISLLVSLTFSSVGIILATKMQTMEGFQLIVNLITLPLLFLSGIFYPISKAPEWLKIGMLLNPLTYGVDAARIVLSGIGEFSIITDIALLSILSAVFMILAMYQFEKTTIG